MTSLNARMTLYITDIAHIPLLPKRKLNFGRSSSNRANREVTWK